MTTRKLDYQTSRHALQILIGNGLVIHMASIESFTLLGVILKVMNWDSQTRCGLNSASELLICGGRSQEVLVVYEFPGLNSAKHI